MSSGSPENREDLLAAFVQEVRQLNGLSASFFRAAASRIGIPVTDLQVIDILDIMGPATAGQLAELTGLTTGAITGMIDRLEKSGFVRRERDPEDGRRVIVRLAPSEEAMRGIGPIFDAIGQGWDRIASEYNDEQLTLLVEFLKRCNAVSREEITRLREAPESTGGDFSAPLGDLEGPRQFLYSGTSQLTLRAGVGLADLYHAHFDGPVPNVNVEAGTVSIRYPQRVWPFAVRQRKAEISLNNMVPWQITIQAGASIVNAELDGIKLVGLEIKGGSSMLQLDLPAPAGDVPIRIASGTSMITVRRPAGVATRVHLSGWASKLDFDDQTLYSTGSHARLQTPGYDAAARRYDIEVSGSSSVVTITTR